MPCSLTEATSIQRGTYGEGEGEKEKEEEEKDRKEKMISICLYLKEVKTCQAENQPYLQKGKPPGSI